MTRRSSRHHHPPRDPMAAPGPIANNDVDSRPRVRRCLSHRTVMTIIFILRMMAIMMAVVMIAITMTNRLPREPMTHLPRPRRQHPQPWCLLHHTMRSTTTPLPPTTTTMMDLSSMRQYSDWSPPCNRYRAPTIRCRASCMRPHIRTSTPSWWISSRERGSPIEATFNASRAES